MTDRVSQLDLANDWAGRLRKNEKKRVFGGQEPTFDDWWPSISPVDKIHTYEQWKDICPGVEPEPEPIPEPEPEPEPEPVEEEPPEEEPEEEPEPEPEEVKPDILSMSYRQLQALAKEFSIKANQGRDALITALKKTI